MLQQLALAFLNVHSSKKKVEVHLSSNNPLCPIKAFCFIPIKMSLYLFKKCRKSLLILPDILKSAGHFLCSLLLFSIVSVYLFRLRTSLHLYGVVTQAQEVCSWQDYKVKIKIPMQLPHPRTVKLHYIKITFLLFRFRRNLIITPNFKVVNFYREFN